MKTKTHAICEHCGYDERTENALHQLPVGTVLKEQYQVGRVLCQGGFGIIYLGWDIYLSTPVAIKEYYPSGMVMRESCTSMSVFNCTGNDAGKWYFDSDTGFLLINDCNLVDSYLSTDSTDPKAYVTYNQVPGWKCGSRLLPYPLIKYMVLAPIVLHTAPT